MDITAYGSLPNKETLKGEPGSECSSGPFREVGRRLGKLDRTLGNVRLIPCYPSETGLVFEKAA